MSRVEQSSLPRFSKPPVAEVALSVQFEPLPNLNAAEMGRLWGSLLRERFPRIEQHASIPHHIERKAARVGLLDLAGLTIRMSPEAPPRLWMINEQGSELVQVQADRFVRNWRRYHDSGLPYPHYDEHIRPELMRDFEAFRTYLKREQLGELAADQCEVTYINHITPSGVWETHGDLDKVFRGWVRGYCPTLSSEPDSIALRLSHALSDEAGGFVGRLYVEIDSALSVPKPDEQPTPLFVLQLVARGSPLGEGIDGIVRFLDLGRSRIVSAFASMTTEQMHRAWERTQ